ncbi:MAG: hypothetical protein JW700_01445 [Candidatus Aenigmarchaeota archaeon]|nr:hypothetical protein [Candidatus Aenigmarchaeota archaeon]
MSFSKKGISRKETVYGDLRIGIIATPEDWYVEIDDKRKFMKRMKKILLPINDNGIFTSYDYRKLISPKKLRDLMRNNAREKDFSLNDIEENLGEAVYAIAIDLFNELDSEEFGRMKKPEGINVKVE